VHALDSVTSGNGMAAMPSVLLHGPTAFRRTLLVYVASGIGVTVIAKAATIVIGLPDWVFSTAILLMLIGLPVILFAGYVQAVARRTLVATPALTPGGGVRPHGTLATIALKASPHLSWKRMTRGGVLALGAFVALVLGFMVTRALGIGPAASLFAKGVIKEQDRVLVADFASPTTDTSLGGVVSEGVRSNLAQSRAISIVRASQVSAALARMQSPRTTRLDLATAREIAEREGYRAVVDGTVTSVSGGQFIVTVRIVAAETGDELASVREVARDASGLIPAIDRATKALRGKLGESLKTVRAAPSLARVTTSSLAALRKYTEGVRQTTSKRMFSRPSPLTRRRSSSIRRSRWPIDRRRSRTRMRASTRSARGSIARRHSSTAIGCLKQSGRSSKPRTMTRGATPTARERFRRIAESSRPIRPTRRP